MRSAIIFTALLAAATAIPIGVEPATAARIDPLSGPEKRALTPKRSEYVNIPPIKERQSESVAIDPAKKRSEYVNIPRIDTDLDKKRSEYVNIPRIDTDLDKKRSEYVNIPRIDTDLDKKRSEYVNIPRIDKE